MYVLVCSISVYADCCSHRAGMCVLSLSRSLFFSPCPSPHCCVLKCVPPSYSFHHFYCTFLKSLPDFCFVQFEESGMYENHTKDTNNCNEGLLNDVKNSFDALEREIRAEFQNLHRFLDEEECNDMERLRRERQKQLTQLKERQKKITEQARDLDRAITVLNSKLAEENSSTLLRVIFYHSSFSPPRFPSCPSRSHVSFVPPAEVDTEVRSGQFVGPLQYRIWKHMKSCLYPNITSMTIDPETAHPNLSLSQSCTSVWFEEDKDTKHCQKNPQRFHFYYCVLGHQSFTTGQHYWEVEVGRKTAWRLGVARQDVPRGEMDATGTSSGLWTLALKGGCVQAHTDPKPTKVNVSVRLVRVGVFLDCEKEEVSFYNAVTMAPIYTFTMGSVDVPLFPFYNPCDADEGKNTGAINIFTPSL
ncbi:zinc-binding protein A33 isoform 3-T3 [Lycodopsis pacificus]